MKQKIEIESWARKAHFHFFSTFEEPIYGVCVNVDCTAAYRFAKANGLSVFLYFLHRSLAAAQQIEHFKVRIEQNEVFLYDRINASTTVPRSNGTYGLGHILYSEDLREFMEGARREIELVSNATDLKPTTTANVIRYSAIPWIDFTSLSHVRRFSVPDSIPRISFGKMTEAAGKRSMPVSIHVHHALVDGLHLGQYIDCFKELLNAR